MGPVNRGRPVYGVQGKSKERKIRIEPFLDEQLVLICRSLGIPVSEGIRIGIQLFIKEYGKQYY